MIRIQNIRLLPLCVLIPMLLSSCELNWRAECMVFEPKIAVEGWIDEGLFANVILTQSMKFNFESDSDSVDLKDIPIRWAKVSVSDGQTEEILVGRMDDRYFPPFIYTGSKLRGEAGKTYTLTISYSGRTLTAQTRIPEPVRIDDVEIAESEESDTLYTVDISFRDDPTEENYYKVFTRVTPGNTRYLSSFMGTVSDQTISSGHKGTINVSRPLSQINKMEDYTPFFKRGDTVEVKLTQLPKEGFDFWCDYENALTSGDNILFPSSANIRSNISGGLGIWCGYGTDIRTVIIPEE